MSKATDATSKVVNNSKQVKLTFENLEFEVDIKLSKDEAIK